MHKAQILNITEIEPRLKHQAIFDRFDSLEQGTSFVIQNDNDPKSLYYQLMAERGQNFTWVPQINGPEVWQVRVGKRPEADAPDSIGAIVAGDYRKSVVFKELGIDFSCGGKQTLNEVCEVNGLVEEDVNRRLSAISAIPASPGLNFQNWSISFLGKYVVQFHHQYIRNNTAFIIEMAQKTARLHGDKYPELNHILNVFESAGKQLTVNMLKEEQSLFPYITELGNAYKNGEHLNAAAFGSVTVPVYRMEAEHAKVVEDFRFIRELAHNYEVPNYVTHGFSILYKMLQEYENDLHLHLHLENNILFPKAIRMENELRQKDLIS